MQCPTPPGMHRRRASRPCIRERRRAAPNATSRAIPSRKLDVIRISCRCVQARTPKHPRQDFFWCRSIQKHFRFTNQNRGGLVPHKPARFWFSQNCFGSATQSPFTPGRSSMAGLSDLPLGAFLQIGFRRQCVAPEEHSPGFVHLHFCHQRPDSKCL